MLRLHIWTDWISKLPTTPLQFSSVFRINDRFWRQISMVWSGRISMVWYACECPALHKIELALQSGMSFQFHLFESQTGMVLTTYQIFHSLRKSTWFKDAKFYL
uniref:Uncharacterized protein n=1 Tax=Araneus ventricosus TaxID=182803 RepID=A0A4Y2IG01_ARAVE|nr:hypothetical protein AVEN_70894-1 [Araneus ventricosus]